MPLGPGRTLIFFPDPSYYLGSLSREDVKTVKTSGCQPAPLSAAEDTKASVLALETLPRGLTSCGLGVWVWPGFGAQAWPQPLQMCPKSAPSPDVSEGRGT